MMRVFQKIQAEGFRWVAIRIRASLPTLCTEFIVADQLTEEGFLAYCPMACKPASWFHKRRARRGEVHQCPLFSRYIFCGLLSGQSVRADKRKHIESFLPRAQSSDLAITVPSSAIQLINDLEGLGEWDDTKSALEKIPWRPGQSVSFNSGPFQAFPGTVTAVESERRIHVLINIFGRNTPVIVASGQIKKK